MDPETQHVLLKLFGYFALAWACYRAAGAEKPTGHSPSAKYHLRRQRDATGR